ncbi:hypothetical protein AMJ51_01230 [Microgenomates bacterium DG_75]|nr:MAG: hypothetical protein AMJ51_01230 [Microgenomates bacterium DG_75]
MENSGEREPEREDKPSSEEEISRRDFLKIVGGIAAGAGIAGGIGGALAALTKKRQRTEEEPELRTEGEPKSEAEGEPLLPRTSEELEATNDFFVLGPETEISLATKGILWVPDGRTPYVSFPNNERVYFISGNASSYALRNEGPQELHSLLLAGKVPEYNFGPKEFEGYNYAAITSVIQTDNQNPYHLYAFTHNEQWQSPNNGSNFTASVGLLESDDGGRHWRVLGVPLKGDDYLPPGEKVTGAGQPCAIIKEGYVYLYYIDWAAGIKAHHPDQIYLARAKITENGSLGHFEHLTDRGFAKELVPGELKSVITSPDRTYAALPGVSFNKYLNRYLCTFETSTGFWAVTSADGISWEDPRLFARFPQNQGEERKKGVTWYSYPTFVSFDESNSEITNRNGFLIHSKGKWREESHKIVVAPARII